MDIDATERSPRPRGSFLLTLAKVWALAMVVYVGLYSGGGLLRSEILVDLSYAVLVYGVAGAPIVAVAYLALTPLQLFVERRGGATH